MKKQLLSQAFLLTAVMVSACQDEHGSQPKLVGGYGAAPGDFPGVVNIGGFCTGAKIGDYIYVTAAHCLYDGPNQKLKSSLAEGNKLRITGDMVINSSTSWSEVTIQEASVHPSYHEQAKKTCSSGSNAQIINPVSSTVGASPGTIM